MERARTRRHATHTRRNNNEGRLPPRESYTRGVGHFRGTPSGNDIGNHATTDKDAVLLAVLEQSTS